MHKVIIFKITIKYSPGKLNKKGNVCHMFKKKKLTSKNSTS